MHPFALILLLALAQTSPQVAVMTDRGWYAPGEQVQITVSVTGFDENETLWLYVDKPDGHNLYFAELSAHGGTFVVTLTQDAPEGSYAVTVMWDHRYVQTGFIVESQPVPEFPFPLAVLLVAFTVATLAISRRKASASAPSLASHPRTYGVH